MPDGVDPDTLMKIYKEWGFLFYDSLDAKNKGADITYPYVLGEGGEDKVFIDVSTEKGKEIYERVTEEMGL